jgi:uncharacterized protein (DUF4415 family)
LTLVCSFWFGLLAKTFAALFRFVKPIAVKLKGGTMIRKKVPLNTSAEDEAISAGIAADPDTVEFSDEMMVRATKRRPGQRGPQKTATKERISIALDPEILEFYRGTGKGWQTRINEDLTDLIKRAGARTS